MKPAINLQTQVGYDKYSCVQSQFDYSKENDFLNEFKYHIALTATKLEKQLIRWIDSHEVESAEEMKEWRERAECVSVLKYFSTRQK